MSQQISSHDLVSLLDLWRHLDIRIFSKLDTAKVTNKFPIMLVMINWTLLFIK
jgi:hypothetical protein